MKKIEAFDSFKKVNESKLTNEELLDFVHKLGYESIDDIKKEKSKLAKLEALFNELNMDNGEKAKKVDEDDLTSGSGTGSETGSDTGSATGTDTTSSTGSDTGSATGTDTTSLTGSDTGSDTGTDTTSSTGDDTTAAVGDTTTNTEAKPKSMHIKSFAEFCGEVEEDKEAKTNSDTMNESEIKSDEQFKEYAMNILKKAHPDDFNEEEANKTIEDLLKDHNGDYGAAIGALNNGLSK